MPPHPVQRRKDFGIMVRTKALRCHAEFKITGVKLEPENVTNLLKLAPTESWTAEKLRKPAKNQLKLKEGGWILSTRGHVISKLPEDHVLWLLNQILESKKQLVKFRELELYPRFVVQCFSMSDFLEVRFSSDLMVKLADCNIPLYFDCWNAGEMTF
jgi:hypothetical protein